MPYKTPLQVKSDEQVQQLFNNLIAYLESEIKQYTIEEKTTSLHIVAKSAFLGVHFQKSALKLNIVLDHPVVSKKNVKVEQVSASRYHNEFKLDSVEEFDQEMKDLIMQAYKLKS
jgi:hypothetical protein